MNALEAQLAAQSSQLSVLPADATPPWHQPEVVHSHTNSTEIVEIALAQKLLTATLSYLVFAVATIFVNKF